MLTSTRAPAGSHSEFVIRLSSILSMSHHQMWCSRICRPRGPLRYLKSYKITARRFALIIPAMPGILKLSRKAPRISPLSGFGPAGGSTNLAKTKPVDKRKGKSVRPSWAQGLGGTPGNAAAWPVQT